MTRDEALAAASHLNDRGEVRRDLVQVRLTDGREFGPGTLVMDPDGSSKVVELHCRRPPTSRMPRWAVASSQPLAVLEQFADRAGRRKEVVR